MNPTSVWPELSIAQWKQTCATVHMWTQIIGKIRTAQMPWINHSWHTTLYVTPRGLTTLAMPYGERSFQIEFDFADHRLAITSSDGACGAVTLAQGPMLPQRGDMSRFPNHDLIPLNRSS